ncbi:hypothetical protein H3C66_01780 [Patescibacteria group bacterium]|nr:hypothetical protein [Patescibacteria group bacterium]
MDAKLDYKLAEFLKLDQPLRFWAVLGLVAIGIIYLFAQLFLSKPTVTNIINNNYYGSNVTNPRTQ